MARIIAWSCATMLSIIVTSCMSGDGPSPPTASELVTQGWQAYSTRSYATAADKFNQAIGVDGNFVDAYNGAGWATARLNQLATSITRFTAGMTKDTANLEIKAGLSIVYNAQRNYAQSILYANRVIATQPAWSFSRDATVSSSDLHLLLAENFFATANYTAALAEVNILNGSFSADVSTIVGQTALAQEIERLRSIV